MAKHIEISFENGVARLTLNRPEKRNALKREFIESIVEMLARIAEDPSLMATALTVPTHRHIHLSRIKLLLEYSCHYRLFV